MASPGPMSVQKPPWGQYEAIREFVRWLKEHGHKLNHLPRNKHYYNFPPEVCSFLTRNKEMPVRQCHDVVREGQATERETHCTSCFSSWAKEAHTQY